MRVECALSIAQSLESIDRSLVLLRETAHHVREGASRLQQTAKALGVPVEFFFDGAPHVSSDAVRASDVAPSFVADFLTTSEGVQLMRAFVRITDASIRRRLISLVKAMAGDENE